MKDHQAKGQGQVMTGIKDIYDMVGSLEHGFVVSRIKRVDKLLELGAFTFGEVRSFTIASESHGVTAEQLAAMSKEDRMWYLNERNKKIYRKE